MPVDRSPERRHPVSDFPVRTHHEEVAVVEPEFGVVGAVRLADRATRVACEQERELVVLGPRRERLDRVRADPDQHHVAAVVKQLCVLITVRMHLDRSALVRAL